MSDEREPLDPAAPGPDTWRTRLGRAVSNRRVRTVAVVAFGVFVAVGLLDLGTGSSQLCGSCHEMESRVESWSRSAHNTVRCVECHQPVRAWYASPLKVLDRGRLLARDIAAHVEGDYPAQIQSSASSATPVPDEVCLQCHDPNRKATSGYRILIDHVEHAERNGSCVSCHVRTAHPIDERSNALSLMSQCFTCHGQPSQPKASAECGVCHPSGYELTPQSHEAAAWKRLHGEVALSDPRQCEMCHEKSFCTDCHGLQMPHPEGWAQGPQGHAQTAELNRDTCGQCHGNRPDMCTMCHHEGYQPVRGSWAQQHYVEVRKRGALYCVECHSATYCIRCHVRAATELGEEQ